MINFKNVRKITIPEGSVSKITSNGKTLWKDSFQYVSFGDSIAAGHAINDSWDADYGERSQYWYEISDGVYRTDPTTIVPGCYTKLLHSELVARYGDNVHTTSFANSGDTVEDLIKLLNKEEHSVVYNRLAQADLVTICIGANNILGPALKRIERYITEGTPVLVELEGIVNQNINTLSDPSGRDGSYVDLFNKLYAINPNATYVFTNVYNPYKHLWLEPGPNGFFKPMLDSIPSMSILGINVTKYIKDLLLDTDIVKKLFNRVNGLDGWVEKWIKLLNGHLRNRIKNYQKGNFVLADTKAVFDPIPNRTVSASKHYNDLVNVEFTRGYTVSDMDWGALWASESVEDFWWNLAAKYTGDWSFDIEGFAAELIDLVRTRVVMPNIDPHPEAYGQYALKCSFMDALGWETLPRRTIKYNANGGTGEMSDQVVVALDNMVPYVNLKTNTYKYNTEGYHFVEWRDSREVPYSENQLVGLNSNLVLKAHWSNIYNILFKHSNKTNLYGDDETGHKECYALYINEKEQADFGTFAEGSQRIIQRPYGSRVRVVVSNYKQNNFLYDDCDCSVYFNGSTVARGYKGTEYSFDLESDVVIDFQWKIAGSLATLNAQSWEDCYITTQ